jgi:8-oxo-dGTP diphosphatase
VKKLVHVAVGVICGTDGKILIAKRPESVHQGGLWEFPGGKVDSGESIKQALARELREELNVDVLASEPLIQIRHHYPDKSVLLDVHRVTRFSGVACGNEGQPIQWVEAAQLGQFEFPAANRPIVSAINLPFTYAITGAFVDEHDFLARVIKVLDAGVGILQLRVPEFSLVHHQPLFQAVADLASARNSQLQINTSVDVFNQLQRSPPWIKTGLIKAGLHLNHHEATKLNARPVADDVLLGVSCHNAQEIEHAQMIGADYLLLSPVNKTLSHPDASPLGWAEFSRLVESANVPVYALGGVFEADVDVARANGAQGIASISAWW